MKQCQTRNSNLSLVINSYIKLQYSPHHSLIKRLHCVTSFNQYLLKVLFLKVDIIVSHLTFSPNCPIHLFQNTHYYCSTPYTPRTQFCKSAAGSNPGFVLLPRSRPTGIVSGQAWEVQNVLISRSIDYCNDSSGYCSY